MRSLTLISAGRSDNWEGRGHDVWGQVMRRSGSLALSVSVAIGVMQLFPTPSHAQSPVRARILRGIQVEESETGWQVRVEFSYPIRYLQHTPQERGDLIQIELSLLEVGANDTPFASVTESLPVSPDLPIPLVDVTYDGNVDNRPQVRLFFSRPVKFRVEQGKDFRSLIVVVRRPGEATTRETSRVASLMDDGREAMARGELEHAIRIYERVLSFPESEHSEQAKELLGLARQRNGQLAHAKAEFEEYLERYPDGPGAQRVRQRLDVLLTTPVEPAQERQDVRPLRSRLDFDGHGSLSTTYFRAERFTALTDRTIQDSSLFSDTYFRGRVRNSDWEISSQLGASYRYDLRQSSSGDETRVTTLLLKGEDREHGLFGTVGRQTQSSGGVVGRFDGVRLGARWLERWTAEGVFGAPLDSPTSTGINTDQYFYGLSLGADFLDESLHTEVFAISEQLYELDNRIAVGGEMRYFAKDFSLLGFLDYDVVFASLNIASLTTNWQISPDLNLNLLADYRRTPILMLRNALIGDVSCGGVPCRNLAELQKQLSKSEIRSQAEDRTAELATVTGNLSYRVTKRLQVSGDVTVTHLSGTPPDEDCDLQSDPNAICFEGTRGSGFEYQYLLQLIGSDLVKEGAVGILGLRVFDGDSTDIYSLRTNLRIPVTRALRINPRVDADYRRQDAGADFLFVKPRLGFVYRLWKLTLDADCAFEYRRAFGGGINSASRDDIGYVLSAGLRMDF